MKANKGSIGRGALHEARRYYSSTSGNAWKVSRHPATCPYPADGPMRFEAERKVTNLVADRGEGPDEVATARATTMELFKWNSRNGAAVSSWIKIGGVGRTGDTFCASYASFFLPRFVSLPSSVLFYNIIHTVDFWLARDRNFSFPSFYPLLSRSFFILRSYFRGSRYFLSRV